jgi:MFS family permease
MAGFFGFNSLGVAIGPVVGGVATDLWGYQAAFVTYALVGAAVLTISLFVKDVRPPARTPGHSPFSFGSINEVAPALRTTFVIIVASSFADFLYRMMATSLLPLYVVTQRGHTSTDLGTLFAVIGAVNVALIVPTGFISDKLGRKAAAAPSAAFLAASYLLFPLAESLPALAAVCFIYACGAGLGNGSKATYSYDVIPEHARGRLQAMRRTVGEVGALTGPILGGVVADAINPGAAFWAFAPLQIVATFLMVFVAKETMGRGRRHRDADAAARG